MSVKQGYRSAAQTVESRNQWGKIQHLSSRGKGKKGAKIDILTDSQAALKALVAHTCAFKLVYECICNLKKLATGNHIKLWWVVEQSDIAGNMKADALAKQRARWKSCGLHKSQYNTHDNIPLQLKSTKNKKSKVALAL
uniref:Uncharacterized protein n=1 Tax=Photinus pyralis TaxID=7054 RepID=A0A1Y1MWK2_PHOPY